MGGELGSCQPYHYAGTTIIVHAIELIERMSIRYAWGECQCDAEPCQILSRIKIHLQS